MTVQQSRIQIDSETGHVAIDKVYKSILGDNFSNHGPQGDYKKINRYSCPNCRNMIDTVRISGNNLRCSICSAILDIPITPEPHLMSFNKRHRQIRK